MSFYLNICHLFANIFNIKVVYNRASFHKLSLLKFPFIIIIATYLIGIPTLGSAFMEGDQLCTI